MSTIRSMSRLCLLGMRQSSKLNSVVTPLVSRTMPTLSTMQKRSMASKVDNEIDDFLKEEIKAEQQNLKQLVDISGFVVKQEGAELTFTKTHGSEKIVVSCNVNHSVDSAEPDDGSQEAPEMRSLPNFEVDIVKADGRTLSFSCSFVAADETSEPPVDGPEDNFLIDEVTMFKGEDWNEKCYAVAGDILDGYLYDLFMDMLSERGVTPAFASQLSDYCSAYEQGQYVNLLQNLQQFVKS